MAARPKRKLTPAEKAEKRRRRLEFMTVFVHGKQKRVRRPPTVDGMPVDAFTARNADPIWLVQNGMYEELHEYERRRDGPVPVRPGTCPGASGQGNGGPGDASGPIQEKRMGIKYSDVEMAFDYVGSDQPCENSAVIHRKTGKVFIASEFTGESDIPEEAWKSDDYVEVPHKNDLDLGKRLVDGFVSRHARQLAGQIDGIFRRPGAYSRYKALLEQHGLLDKWFDFEHEATKAAILEWCRDNGLEVEVEVEAEEQKPEGTKEER